MVKTMARADLENNEAKKMTSTLIDGKNNSEECEDRPW